MLSLPAVFIEVQRLTNACVRGTPKVRKPNEISKGSSVASTIKVLAPGSREQNRRNFCRTFE
jgi:hypothetical protein